ncbi:MAG: hypothetical protein ONB24_15255 [candidate division KSB1 bacterium]|nr:hypothetical protein [candidate division KSB1 bacterium]
MADRLERLRRQLVLDWGGMCRYLGIKRSMLHYLRTGARNPSPKLLRKIIEAERAAGLLPPETGLPTSGKPASGDFQRLEKLDRAELKKLLEDVNRMKERLERLLGGGS